jgi:hypothetical protein
MERRRGSQQFICCGSGRIGMSGSRLDRWSNAERDGVPPTGAPARGYDRMWV